METLFVAKLSQYIWPITLHASHFVNSVAIFILYSEQQRLFFSCSPLTRSNPALMMTAVQVSPGASESSTYNVAYSFALTLYRQKTVVISTVSKLLTDVNYICVICILYSVVLWM